MRAAVADGAAETVVTNAVPAGDPPAGAASPARQRGPTWRQLRESLRLSLRDVEELTGINRGMLSRIERIPEVTPDRARTLLKLYESRR